MIKRATPRQNNPTGPESARPVPQPGLPLRPTPHGGPGAGAARPAGDSEASRPGDQAQLRTRTVHTGHQTVIYVAGEVDIATTDVLRAVLRQEIAGPARRPRLSVDLSQVTFMDAGGLGVLVHWQDLARAVGIELVVCDAHRLVRRIIHITGLTDRLGLT